MEYIKRRALITQVHVVHDYLDCHKNKMTTPLNVLCTECLYLGQNMDFSTYKGVSDGKASWTPTVCQRHQQGTKLVSGKIANYSYSCKSLRSMITQS